MHYGTAFTKQVTGTLGADPLGYYNYNGTPSPSMVNWFPFLQSGTFTGQGQAGWSVTGNDQYVVMGGEFPTAGGKPQQGLVRFAVPSIAPKKSGPEANVNLKPKLNSLAAGTVRVSWQTTWDRDDLNLKYQVVRDGKTATPIYETTADATFWNEPFQSFTDKGLVAGRTYSYRIYAIDPNGNTLASPTATVVVSSTGTIGTYAQAVLDTAPTTYWRFGEADATSTSTVDWAGSNDGLVGTGVTRNLDSAVGDSNPSFGFNGSSANLVSTPTAVTGPSNYSNEMWIKTTTTSGGKILGRLLRIIDYAPFGELLDGFPRQIGQRILRMLWKTHAYGSSDYPRWCLWGLPNTVLAELIRDQKCDASGIWLTYKSFVRIPTIITRMG